MGKVSYLEKLVQITNQMKSVILQPCADPVAFDHFQDTIEADIATHKIRKFIAENDWKSIRQFYPNGNCRIWGIEPKSGINVKKWQRIRAGDEAFFSRHSSFIASGTVTLTIRSRRLARFLWGDSEESST